MCPSTVFIKSINGFKKWLANCMRKRCNGSYYMQWHKHSLFFSKFLNCRLQKLDTIVLVLHSFPKHPLASICVSRSCVSPKWLLLLVGNQYTTWQGKGFSWAVAFKCLLCSCRALWQTGIHCSASLYNACMSGRKLFPFIPRTAKTSAQNAPTLVSQTKPLLSLSH